MYSLPFKEGQKIIEIGGGTRPVFRPNLDIRQEDGVDIVADMSKKLPLNSGEWDGVFSKFAIEHISFREVKAFIAEIYRILKPNGVAVFVTANLLEQARMLTKVPDWEDKWTEMVFGSQDYPENSHKCGGSPQYWINLFQEVGFSKIVTVPWPEWRGDMVIEVTKTEERNKLFDKHYFNGGHKVGGYANEGYWDYPCHWITFDKIMREKPKSVLEVGCSRGYILKKIQDAGIPAMGLEISHHCVLTRVCNGIQEYDICKTPWPFTDKQFDLSVSCAVLEHIPEEHVDNVLKEIDRVSARGLHGVDFGEQDDGFDKTHCTLKDKEWWQSRTSATQLIVNKEDLERPEMTIYEYLPETDDKFKLNIGCYITMFHYGWVNIDMLNLQDFAKSHGYKFLQRNVAQGLLFEANTVDLIYCSHMIEHLTYEEGENFLKECYRVMKPGAVGRFIMPDAALLIDKYKEKSLNDFSEINDGAEKSRSNIGKLWALVFSGHQAAYDWEGFREVARRVGFEVKLRSFLEGDPQILKETIDLQPELSLYVEIVK